MAIIYLHGFASSGSSPKVDMIRQAFPNEKIIAPDLHPDPQRVIRQVNEVIGELHRNGERRFLFVGTSLGGFYAWYFSTLYDAPAILINPAVAPHVQTAIWVGPNLNFATGQTFEWKPEYLDSLREMREFARGYDPKLITLEVARDDELLDSQQMIDAFPKATVHVYETGGHRFSDLNPVIPHIREVYEGIRELSDLLHT